LLLSGFWHICSTAGEQPTGQLGLTSKAEEEGKGKVKVCCDAECSIGDGMFCVWRWCGGS